MVFLCFTAFSRGFPWISQVVLASEASKRTHHGTWRAVDFPGRPPQLASPLDSFQVVVMARHQTRAKVLGEQLTLAGLINRWQWL